MSQYRLSSNLCGQLKEELTEKEKSLNTASAVTFVVISVVDYLVEYYVSIPPQQ